MTHVNIPTIKNHVSTLSKVVKSSEKKNLGSVLSLVDSSHSAIFIYNDNDEFLGLVSPYKTIYQHSFPYSTLVSSIIFKPPKIKNTAKFYEVAKHMVSTKIYMLPVFDANNTIEGVIYGKDIVKEVIKKPELLKFIKENVRLRKPITAPVDSLVRDIFHDLKEKGVSRLILVDDNGVMKGIVTRRDVMQSLIKPTSKMRFPNEGTFGGHKSFAGEKDSRKKEPVKKFSTSRVSSLPDNTSLENIIIHLAESKRKSVVLVSKENVPTGFLSMKDILKAIAAMKPKETISLRIKKPSDAVSPTELARATRFVKAFGLKLGKRIKIQRIEMTTNEPKTQKGSTHEFNTTIRIIPVKGDPIIAMTKRRDFFEGVQEATKELEKQQRRQVRSKN